MEVEEYLFAKPKQILQATSLGALLLCITAIALTIAGFIWPKIVIWRPQILNSCADPFILDDRREGLFQTCSMNDTHNCYDHTYGYYPENSNLTYYSAFAEIIEYRWLTVFFFSAALLFAVLATAGLITFLYLWHKAVEDSMGLLLSRPIISLILSLSGILYQFGLFFIHLLYLKEKTSFTDMIPYLFPLWPVEMRRNVDIQYSFCYYFFWASMTAIHLAAIIHVVATVITSQYNVAYDDENTRLLSRKQRNSLPRFSVQDEIGVERIFVVDSP